jgi:hypothetical protein
MERLPSFVLSEYRISVFCLLKILCVVLNHTVDEFLSKFVSWDGRRRK